MQVGAGDWNKAYEKVLTTPVLIFILPTFSKNMIFILYKVKK